MIKAKGVLLSEHPLPWFVNEEEIPFAGTIVTPQLPAQRAGTTAGPTCGSAATRETGRGVGSSNLRFDQIDPLQPSASPAAVR